MEQIIRQAYAKKNWDLLVSLLLNKVEMIQIQYALGPEDFRIFVSCFELFDLSKYQNCELYYSDFCYFVTGGLLMKKNDKQKQIKLKKSGSRKQALIMEQNKSLIGLSQTINKGLVTKIQDFLSGDFKILGYYYSNQDCNIILKTNQKSLPSQIIHKLRAYYNEKLAFINRLDFFSQIPRFILQEFIHLFKFIKICFNDLIYSKNLRTQSIFILMKGQIIIQSQGSSKGIILKPPNILGEQKFDQQQIARCLTQFCICYSIEKSEFENIYKRKAILDSTQYEGLKKTTNGQLRVSYLKKINFSPLINCNNESNTSHHSPHDQNNQISHLINMKKHRYRKIQSIDSSKKIRIKQHFSSYLSEKFGQYSSKISKNLFENNQNPILYQIRPMVPSVPNYQQIQNRVKQIRLKKMAQVKQYIKSKSVKSVLKIVKSQNQPQTIDEHTLYYQNDQINSKILRNLNYKISKQIHKKYGTKMRIC